MQEIIKSEMFRTVVEMSCMSNNEEVILYTKRELTDNTEVSFLARSSFDNPKIVISRPIINKELEEGLKISKPIHSFDENPPMLTKLLDALVLIKKWSSGCKKSITELEITPSFCIAMFIGSSYYDCMSGGMPIFEILIFRELCKHPSVNLDEPVYPNKDDEWRTIRDWLKDTEQYQCEKYLLEYIPTDLLIEEMKR